MRKVTVDKKGGTCDISETYYLFQKATIAAMTHSFELDFVEPSALELPGPSIAKIFIKASTQDEEGFMYITPDCMGMAEFNHEIDRLKHELEELRKKAKKKFAR